MAGDDRAAVRPHCALRWARAGAVAAACTGDPADVVGRVVAADPPAAVLAIGGNEAALRERLDPLGLELGPPVIAVEELVDAGRAFDARRRRGGCGRSSSAARCAPARPSSRPWSPPRPSRAAARDRGRALDTLRRLALAAEYRDDNTHEHTQRVGQLAAPARPPPRARATGRCG